MRDTILKLYVDADNYKLVQESPCNIVEFIRLSDIQPIRKMDFIIFADNNGNETLRNMWELTNNHVHYTSLIKTSNHTSDDFPLIVVLTNLYESIMHLRHGAFTEQKFIMKHFPIDMVRREVRMIELCIDLLDEAINVNQFIEKLNAVTFDDNTYVFESSSLILKSYLWHYERNETIKESIEKLRLAATEMNRCISDKKKWRDIWRLAYEIHNEPAAIYDSLHPPFL